MSGALDKRDHYLLANGQITIPTGTNLTPYLTGGVGVLFVAFEESDLL